MYFAATSATQTEPEQVDLSNVNDFFTSEMVQKRFIVQNVIQFIIVGLGWLVSYEVWRIFNPNTSTDPDVESLANFLLDDETAVGNVSRSGVWNLVTSDSLDSVVPQKEVSIINDV